MPKKLSFPEDESCHNHIIEWWYFNGHLKDKDNNRYAFMNCLFKADNTKVKIPFLSKIPTKNIYFSHSIISDIKRKKFYPRVSYFDIASKESFTKKGLFVFYNHSFMDEYEKYKYHIKTKGIDLFMESTKKPLLEGGTGFLNLKAKTTYYYSLTRLKTRGHIIVNNKWVDVKGISWMDHQWANAPYTKDKWNWFSIQLDNNTDIVCFEFGIQEKKSFMASVSLPNGKQLHTKDLSIEPIGAKWESSKTGALYPLEWSIKIPKIKADIKVKAPIKNQEVIFGSINYWEGPLGVNARLNGKEVKGYCFMELAGYHTTKKYFLMREIEESIEKQIPHIKKAKSIFKKRAKSIVKLINRKKESIIKLGKLSFSCLN